MVFYEQNKQDPMTSQSVQTDTVTASIDSEQLSDTDNENNYCDCDTTNRITVDKFVLDLNNILNYTPDYPTYSTFEQKIYAYYNKFASTTGSAVLVMYYISTTPEFNKLSATNQFTQLILPSMIGYFYGKYISPVAMSMYLMKKLF
jgi:hypothetical protein